MTEEIPSGSDSPRSLDDLLEPMPVAQFLAEVAGQRPLHLKGGGDRFRGLLDWDGLARLIETTPLEPPRLTILRAGEAIPASRYLRRPGGIARIDGGALSTLCAAGATMIINHIDDLVGEVAALADAVADRLDARVAVNLYATCGSEHGFGLHWDHHDVIVLQLAGRKEWPIYQPTRHDPLRDDTFAPPPPSARPHEVFALDAGDVLYVPRGWIHAPAPLGDRSLHLTFAITRPTGAGFLEWLARELAEDARIRAALPAQAGLADWKSRTQSILREAIDDGAVERFLAHKEAERGARPRISFDHFGRLPVGEWTEHTLLRPASWHRLPVIVGPDGSAGIEVAGKTWPLSDDAAAALRQLTSTRPIALRELEQNLDTDDVTQLRQLLGLLATMGLVSAAPR